MGHGNFRFVHLDDGLSAGRRYERVAAPVVAGMAGAPPPPPPQRSPGDDPPVPGGYRGAHSAELHVDAAGDAALRGYGSAPAPLPPCEDCGGPWERTGFVNGPQTVHMCTEAGVAKADARAAELHAAEALGAALPSDSAERKRIPLCTGLLDYFPSALSDAFDALLDGDEWLSGPASILGYLTDREYTRLFCACLDALQDELCGPPTQCRSHDPVKRWGAALIAVAQVSVYGNDKHNPGQPLHHARGKSMDHADCIARHTFDAGGFDGPMRHSACRAWRAGALAQEAAEAAGAPMARGARGAS